MKISVRLFPETITLEVPGEEDEDQWKRLAAALEAKGILWDSVDWWEPEEDSEKRELTSL